MRIGLCASLKPAIAPPPDLSYLEPKVAETLCPRGSDQEFAQCRQAVRACGLPVEALCVLFPGDMPLTGPAVDEARIDQYIGAVCRRAGELGIVRVVFGSGGARKVPDGFDKAAAARQLVAHMRRWGPLFAAARSILVLEPLNKTETNIVNSVAEGAALVRQVAHPAVRLLADTYHMSMENEPPQAIVDAGELIWHVHTAQRDGRLPLGVGTEDQRPYFAALKRIGYDGRVSIEAKWNDMPAELAKAVAELRRQWEEA
jgi:sugar phosphate isomerase/epimerase